ncbi:hypothetical protein ABT104_29150 [Streptomyces mobaraensis]|uniref:hypothetical protein n=1 Tax=Streptomyces mobaraensis TaxID=35621 RepID=UPI00332D5A18
MTADATHYWITVLDIEGFSTRTDPVQRSLRAAMYEVTEDAEEQAGLLGRAAATEDRGDGLLTLWPATVPPVLLAGALVRALNDGLAQKAAMYSPAHAMRFRLALHQGLAVRDERGWSGDAVNTACRLVDAQPLRDVLTAAPEAVLAFIVSDEIHHAVIRHGHRSIDPAAYAPLRFTAKNGRPFRAWVHVPGLPVPPGLPDGTSGTGGGAGADAYDGAAPAAASAPHPADRPAAAAPAPARETSSTVTLNAGVVHGDQIARDKVVTVHGTGTGSGAAPTPGQGPVRP